MKNYLSSHYQFRYNHLRETTEWRPLGGGDTAWRELDSWALNSIYCDVHAARVKVRFADLRRLLSSNYCESYHPFADYLKALPRWDGRDRITALAQRVSDEPLWILVLHRWMLAMVAQWQGLDQQTANSMVPVLVSERQGLGKSTFWRSLVPSELTTYYLDKLEFTTFGEYDRMMEQCCLINIDEMDALTDRAMAKFKAATQMQTITGHSTLRTRITVGRRMASFCATTNRKDILRDRTGSRRFYCQEVVRKINVTGINHQQIYAQLLAELAAGDRTWFTKAEERRIQHHNRTFYPPTPLQQALATYYRAPMEIDVPTDVQLVSAQEMCRTLATRHPRVLAGISMKEAGHQIAALYPVGKRTNAGRLYKVIPRTA